MKNIFSKLAKHRRKKVMISIVALVLSVCMLTSVTYSWIDKISEISVVTPKPDGNTTLTIDSTTDSELNLQADGTTIDIGSYFNMGGDMHLTGCSSNGKDFFFKSGEDDSTISFRRGTANDVNVNYISCTFKVTSSFDNTVLWFNELPQLTMGETSLDNYLRCAVTVDDETTVFAKGGSYDYVNSTTVNKTTTTGYATCEAFGAGNYLFEKCENYLFFIDKGDTKTVNVKLWIEDPKSELDIISKELSLKLSFLTTLNRKTVTFRDCTFSSEKINQVSSGTYYACLGTLENEEYDLDTYWAFTKTDDNRYTVDIPIIYSNEKLIIMNCDDSYGTGKNQLNDETINYNYIWDAGQMGAEDTYNAMGNLTDSKNVQNGFWGTAIKVFADDQMGLNVADTTMLLNETENNTSYAMYYNVVKGKWAGYIHSTSKNVQFNVKGTANYWGYHSDTGNQTKPDDSDTYTIYDINNGSWTKNSTLGVFALAGDFNDWKGTPMLLSNATDHTYYAAVDLTPGKHEFKIINNSEKYWLGSESATFSFGSDETKMSASATFSQISGDSGNVPVEITSLYGGTVLFLIDKDDNKVTLKYTPSTTNLDEEVRSYVMLNSRWADNWTSKINHWAESASISNPIRDIKYVSTFKKKINQSYNHFKMDTGSWDGSQGTWYNREAYSYNEIYFEPTSDWKGGGSRFAAYFYGSSGEEAWISLTADGDGTSYKGNIPTGTWSHVIFCRMNGSNSTNSWDTRWNQTANISLSRTKGDWEYEYKLYYVNMDMDATKMQWVSSDNLYKPSGGYSMGTPENGALYYLTHDSANACGKSVTNIQKVTSATVSSTRKVGTTITFGNGSTPDTGTAYKGYNFSYYVTNTDTGTTWVTDKYWTPLYAGNYQVTLRVNDGYITTAESTAVKFTVS